MSYPIVLDLETKKTFREVGGNFPEKLGVSIVCLYDYGTDKFFSFFEKEFDKLFKILEKASLIIGFNSSKFDLPALSSYYVGNISSFPQLDLLEDVKNELGKRIALNELAGETLGVKKSGHGLMAIDFFHEGKLDELTKYCLDDVKITRDLYEFGKKNGKIFYKTAFGRREIKVKWSDSRGASSDINLTLPI